ncbi:MAG: alanine racemase [Rhodocyclaceae bacterium]|nr:alanine racemase [Rhodocyclaceae bacterium]
MSRPIRARIDRTALRQNFQIVRRHAPAAKMIWAVVKANAYGHGLLTVARTLADLADGFALIEIEGARALRAAGFAHPLLMLEGFYHGDEIAEFAALRAIPVLHSPHQVAWLQASSWPADLPIVLKLDTGMNRLGFTPETLQAAYAALAPRVAEIVAMTHFADADGASGIAWQYERFLAGVAGLRFAAVSLANSATLLKYPYAHGDWLRPGIMLYGGSPFSPAIPAADWGLSPVMTLEAEIIAERTLVPGNTVGYGCTFRAERPMRIGIVACGYADGYPRHASTGAPVLVDGQRTRLVGRVSMDKLAVDLTDFPPQSGLGSIATLWGRHGRGMLSADEVAAAAGTIAYELFCALAARVPVVEEG